VGIEASFKVPESVYFDKAARSSTSRTSMASRGPRRLRLDRQLGLDGKVIAAEGEG
jgi:hypothetical protein